MGCGVGTAEDVDLAGDGVLGAVRPGPGGELADLPVKAVDGPDDPPCTGDRVLFRLIAVIAGTVILIIPVSAIVSGRLFLSHYSIDNSDNLPVGGGLRLGIAPLGGLGGELGVELLLPGLGYQGGFLLGDLFLCGLLLQAEFLQDLGQFLFEIHNVYRFELKKFLTF